MLMLAEYGAMFSLGFLMSVGIASTTLASVVVLPALLVVLGRAR
jgi:predicted RND superfamily exporter protein